MANDNQPKLRLIKAGAGTCKQGSRGKIEGNQYLPAIPASCELLPKLRFMRVDASLMLCIQHPGERDFKPVSFTFHRATVAIAPVLVKEPMDADQFKAAQAWPHKAQFNMQSLDARSLRAIMEVAQEPSVLDPATDGIVEQAFRAGWLDQSIGKRSMWENVRAKCREVGIKSPSYKAVAMRIDCLISREVLRFHPLTREGKTENPGGYPSD